jgi:hypothetical protein
LRCYKDPWSKTANGNGDECIKCDIRSYGSGYYGDEIKTCCWKDVGRFFIEWYCGALGTYCNVFDRENRAAVKHLKKINELLPFDISEERVSKLLLLI